MIFLDDNNNNLQSSAENIGMGNGCRDVGKPGGECGNENGRKQLEKVTNQDLKVEPLSFLFFFLEVIMQYRDSVMFSVH